MTRRSLLLAASALPAASAPVKSTLESLAWLAGRWKGQLPWGQIEEIWSPESEGVMMGMFRMSNRGKPSLYEFMTLERKGEGVGLKIRHFNGQLVAREEKDKFVDFDLVALDAAGATFFVDEGAAKVTLVYRKTGADSMAVDFSKVPVEGKPQKMVFPYTRGSL
jgi:hypothetical protein